MLPEDFGGLGARPAALGLRERLLVVEVALDLDRPDLQQARLDGVPPFDLDVLLDRAEAANAGPEALVRIFRANSFEDREQLLTAFPALRGDANGELALLQHLEVAEGVSLALVLLGGELSPPPLQQLAQVARLPPADLERAGAARVEGAPERRPRRVRHLAARQVARDRPQRIRLRDRPQQRLRVRVLRVGVD